MDHLVLKISEEEKQKLGRELHDDLGQQLTCLELLVHSIQRQLDQDGQLDRSKLDQLSELISKALVSTKNLAGGLSLSGLEESGLPAALKQWTSNLDEALPMKITFHGPEQLHLRDSESAVHIYRIAQEAVQNAIKHAAPSVIQVELKVSNTDITLRIHDNGNFSDGIQGKPGSGMKSMQYRSRVLNASLRIDKNAQGGTTVCCKIPSIVVSNNVDRG